MRTVFLLNNGMEIPALGFGVFMIQDQEVCAQSVCAAIKEGYRLIDTAAIYLNETGVGKGIKDSVIKREEIFLTTKIWVQDHGYESAKKAIDKSLKRLDVDYLDMYLIHRPFGDTVGTWKAMEEAVRDGKIKSIGVCNHSVNQLKKILEVADINPVVNQLECHPFFQAHDLRPFLEKQEISLEAWYPLGHGHKELLSNQALKQIAKQHNKSVSQVILRWHFQERFIAIPKSTSLTHIKENIDILDLVLTEEEMNIIRSMDTGKRIHDNLEDDVYGKQIMNFRADI